MNMCKIMSIYLIANKKYGKNTVVTVEPGTGSMKVGSRARGIGII